MKCEILFSGKTKKTIINFCLLNKPRESGNSKKRSPVIERRNIVLCNCNCQTLHFYLTKVRQIRRVVFILFMYNWSKMKCTIVHHLQLVSTFFFLV